MKNRRLIGITRPRGQRGGRGRRDGRWEEGIDRSAGGRGIIEARVGRELRGGGCHDKEEDKIPGNGLVVASSSAGPSVEDLQSASWTSRASLVTRRLWRRHARRRFGITVKETSPSASPSSLVCVVALLHLLRAVAE